MTINTDDHQYAENDGKHYNVTRRYSSNSCMDADEALHSNDRSTLIQVWKPKNYGAVKGQIPQHERLTYTWKEIDVFGEMPGDTKKDSVCGRLCSCLSRQKKDFNPRRHLLKNVTGYAKSGELLAVMGSSGAGKTTLLNALAFRSPPGVKVSSTSIRALNGIPVNAEQLRARCAYVQQDDLFIAALTTKEHLIFQAMLRMGKDVPKSVKLNRVNEVLQELSLIKCADTIIGAPGRMKGLSGGERKRLAFASETLTDPHLLLCDEPTSGLDSFMAHSVLQVLKGMTVKGKTIILTIHQPSSELYCLFDKVLLMAEGRVAFLGSPYQAAEFFSQLGIPCPPNYNPADFYVQMLAIAPNKELECRDTIKKICDSFAVSTMARDVMEIATAEKDVDEFFLQPVNGASRTGYRSNWWTQFYYVLWRSWLTVLKDPMLVKVRLLQTAMVAILIGSIYFGQKLDQDGVMNINGSLFLFLTNMTFQNVFAVINVFSAELPVFLREKRSRLFRVDTYFLGKTIAEVPLFIAVPFVFTSITYPMIGLRAGTEHYFTALFIVTLVANVATSFGYFISCASSSVSMALSIGPPVIIPFLIFGGFFLNSASVPAYFEYLSFLSWFRYANEALLINQWSNVQEGEIACTRLNVTCPSSGEIILETFNFREENFSFDVVCLCILIALFRLGALFCLWLRSRSKE
ncbi:protein white [Sabethes cyaneus]|uniref:protein white n=1 Tax=Sabethes cyaneus TaxID=53552 RepID=UPI00237D773A|nr:protein white [Sabethes cyaneus]XP_053681584.1 protein white [Sabethes cyaneus]XP_053681591.1 protein white [Sabethes cyaneus]XP_053681597.1 protein white [Sabethes cyaneus]